MRFFSVTRVSGARRRRCSMTPTARFAVATLVTVLLQASVQMPVDGASLAITPQTITLAPGAVQQFSVTGSKGKLRFYATGGTITSRGLYRAGTTPGSFTVSVKNRDVWAKATVVISAPAPAPLPTEPVPPPPTDGGVSIFPGDETAVPIFPGESIQAAVNAYPVGTSFVIKAGVHVRQTVKPKDGMSFVGEPGAILDGENAAGIAFDLYQTSNVVIRGLRITRYAPPEQNSAIDASSSQGALIENNEIDHNANPSGLRAYGLTIGSTSIIRGNSIHHNGWLGINGYGGASDTLIEGNEIYLNPPARVNDTVSEAANVKLFDCGRITIRGNYVHDSLYRGIWVDTMRPDVTIDGNRVVNHGRAGIWYEVSYRGVIRNNYVENAGYHQTRLPDWLRGGGIEVSNSPDVSVLNNTVVNSLNGIIGLQAQSYRDGPYGKSQLRNLLVQGNTILMPSGQTGITENVGSAEVFTSWNNRFVGNRFELLNNPNPFAWMGQQLDERQWQAYGQGTNDLFAR